MQELYSTPNRQFAMVSATKSADDLVFTAISMLKTVKLALTSEFFSKDYALSVVDSIDETRALLELNTATQERFQAEIRIIRRNDLDTIDMLFTAFREKLSAFEAIAVAGNLPDESAEGDAYYEAVRMLLCYPCKTLEGLQHRNRLIQGNSTIISFIVGSDDFHLFLNSMSGQIGRQ